MDETTFRQLIDDHARFPTALLATFQGAPEEVLPARDPRPPP